MTKIDIFSGFLGAGKTTLIKKLIAEAYTGEKLVLVENEFGDVGVDGAFLQEADIQVTEMNSGCICCSLSGDFKESLGMVMDRYAPERILIEPSGVGKLSDVVAAVEGCGRDDIQVNGLTVVADAKKCRMYLKNFGEFYSNQLEHASCIVLSRTGDISPEKLHEAIELIRGCNPGAVIVTTPWDQISGIQILEAMERRDTLQAAVEKLAALAAEEDDDECDDPECECHHHHHHDDEDGEEHEHHHHHHHDDDDDDDEEEHGHHHHHDDDDDDDDEEEHGHHHHHHDDEGHEHHHHHHHHGHDADEVFQSWGVETAKAFSEADLRAALDALDDGRYGAILRCKGVLACADGTWIHFDYVPEEKNVRRGPAAVTGRLCVIGSKLDEAGLKTLFGV